MIAWDTVARVMIREVTETGWRAGGVVAPLERMDKEMGAS